MKARETFFRIVLIFAAVVLTVFIIYGQDKIAKLEPSLVPDEKESGVVVQKESKKESNEVSVILAGDIMLGRSVMKTSIDKNDPLYPFRKVADRLKDADLVFVNLENPIINNCPIQEGGFKFCTKAEMLQGLVYAGIDVVSLANNHSGNYGEEGLGETRKYLTSVGIKYVEQGGLTIVEVRDVNFGFLGFDYVFKEPKEEDYQLARDSKGKVDVLLVSPHWGVEYTAKPTPEQREWAKNFIDAGADVIVGHHPHWVQEVEYINNKPVFYSLGNFVFDQMWSEETRKGIVIELTFEGRVLVDQKIYDTYISSWAQPEFLEEE